MSEIQEDCSGGGGNTRSCQEKKRLETSLGKRVTVKQIGRGGNERTSVQQRLGNTRQKKITGPNEEREKTKNFTMGRGKKAKRGAESTHSSRELNVKGWVKEFDGQRRKTTKKKGSP